MTCASSCARKPARGADAMAVHSFTLAQQAGDQRRRPRPQPHEATPATASAPGPSPPARAPAIVRRKRSPPQRGGGGSNRVTAWRETCTALPREARSRRRNAPVTTWSVVATHDEVPAASSAGVSASRVPGAWLEPANAEWATAAGVRSKAARLAPAGVVTAGGCGGRLLCRVVRWSPGWRSEGATATRSSSSGSPARRSTSAQSGADKCSASWWPPSSRSARRRSSR